MIKSKELREGNLIQRVRSGTTIVVTPDHILSISKGDTDYDAIPLTPEILEKAGFENNGLNHFIDSGGNDIFFYSEDNSFEFILGGYADIELNYLHQLQNLYFPLTGKELTINF